MASAHGHGKANWYVVELRSITGGSERTPLGFEVGWVQDGEHHRARLDDTAGVRFEAADPARAFPSWKGQRSNTGWWWFATTGRHVGYESLLERDHGMLLDHDQTRHRLVLATVLALLARQEPGSFTCA